MAAAPPKVFGGNGSARASPKTREPVADLSIVGDASSPIEGMHLRLAADRVVCPARTQHQGRNRPVPRRSVRQRLRGHLQPAPNLLAAREVIRNRSGSVSKSNGSGRGCWSGSGIVHHFYKLADGVGGTSWRAVDSSSLSSNSMISSTPVAPSLTGTPTKRPSMPYSPSR